MFNKEFTVFKTGVATKRMWHDINNAVGPNGFKKDEANFREFFLGKAQVSREDYSDNVFHQKLVYFFQRVDLAFSRLLATNYKYRNETEFNKKTKI